MKGLVLVVAVVVDKVAKGHTVQHFNCSSTVLGAGGVFLNIAQLVNDTMAHWRNDGMNVSTCWSVDHHHHYHQHRALK